jgi:glycosyltransferase involved in cell wall biosynthesis
MKFSIITPVYNAEKYIEDCIKSVLHQDYDNWEQIIVDDCSTDFTGVKIEAAKHSKIKVITSNKRMFGAYSHLTALRNVSPDSDVIVHLDGDDRFYLNKSLRIIKEAYEKTGCLGSYGNYIASDGSGSVCRPSIGPVREQIRMGWPFSHARTFKSSLIPVLTEDMLKDKEGKWLTSAADVAIITPIYEAIGLDRLIFINAPLVWYNRDNILNDDKVNVQDQVRCAFEVYNKPIVERIA